MYTQSGKIFDPLDPDIDSIDIYDIAHALSNITRWGGHAKYFYSVAEHSSRMSDYVSEKNRAWALLHDASEAFLGDLVSPIKELKEFEIYRKYEKKIMNAVCRRFQLQLEEPEEVKNADMKIRATEARDLTNIPQELFSKYEPFKFRIVPMTPETAKRYFISNARKCGLL